MRLAHMVGQLVHPLFETGKVLTQFRQFDLDDMDLLARLHILQHGTCGIEHRHQRGRRHDPYPFRHRVFDGFGMVGVNFREHRLRRHEHHRAVRGFTGDDVFAGDIVNMFFDVEAELFLCQRALDVVRRRLEHAVIIFQRKLGIDRHHAGRRRQPDHAVGTGAVGQRRLHLERAGRQHIAHQGLELHFTEGTTRTFVAQQLLQADHAAGQAVDFFLRFVDGRQPRHHVDEGFVGFLETFIEALIDLAGDFTEAGIDFGIEYFRRRRQAFEHGFALGAHFLHQGQTQGMQHITGLFQFFGRAQALPITRLRNLRPQPVTLAGQPFMQVAEHRAVFVFQRLLQVAHRQCDGAALRHHHADDDAQNYQ